MEHLCSELFLTVGTVCSKWILQATEHCAELITENESFYHRVRGLLFYKRTSSLECGNVPITVLPNRLEIDACTALLESLTMDYVRRDPEYSAYLEENAMLLRVFGSLLRVMVLGVFTLILFYANFPKPMRREKLEKKAQIETKRAVPATEENVKHRTTLEPGRTPMPVIRMRSKLELLESIFNKKLPGSVRLPGQQEKPGYDSETQLQLQKGLDFINNNTRKLHLMVLWDDGGDGDDEQVRVENNDTTSPPPPSFVATPPRTSRKSNSTGARLKSAKSSSTAKSSPSKSLAPADVNRQRRATENKSLLRTRKTSKINEI